MMSSTLVSATTHAIAPEWPAAERPKRLGLRPIPEGRALAIDTMPRTAKYRPAVIAVAVSIALHGGAALATHDGDRREVNGSEVVALDVDILEPAVPLVVAPPDPMPESRPQPRMVVPMQHHPPTLPAAPGPPPPPPPPSFGVRPDETAPQGGADIQVGDTTNTDLNARGDAHGVDGGAPGGISRRQGGPHRERQGAPRRWANLRRRLSP